MKPMRAISLFSGIGGFDLAMERAGIVVDTVCEIDKQAQGVLKRHFPGARLIDNVYKVGKNTHEPGTVDIICGGFPCQDVSIAGKREGLAGERSGLWSQFDRVIGELRPSWAVIENVPGLLSSNEGRDFAQVVYGMAKRGYGVVWRVFDSRYFGVAQQRRRVFIVASLGNGSAAEVLFERESCQGNIAQGGQAGKDIAATIVNRIGKGGFTDPVNDNIIPFSPFSHYGYEMSDISATIHNYRQLSGSEHMIIREKGDVPFVGVRRLMPVECERLQGFPDGWTDGQSDSARYKQLGNAVTVSVAKWIMKRIVQVTEENYGHER